MNVFYEELPEALEINGREYPVITDFREWIRFSDMLKSDIPPEFKLEFLSEMFLEEVPDLYTEDGIEEAMDAITSFLSLSGTEFPDISSDEANSEEESEEVEYEEQREKKAIYYEQDAPYIISAFRRE